MAVVSSIPRGDVTASLNFYQPPADNSKPYNIIRDIPKPDEPSRNYDFTPQEVVIQDIRGRETEFSLDRDAFQLIQGVPASREAEFVDDESIKEKYYPEVEQLLLDSIPGSNKIYIFDHTIRRSHPDAHRSPVKAVHIDQTAKSIAKRIQRYFPDEADSLLAARYRIVNVWRPLNKTPVEASPLAMASTSSVEDQDVVPVEHRYFDGYIGETAAIKHNAQQKWYYVSGMTGSERLLLECFDSESLKPGSKIGGRVPHSAFEDPRTRADAEGRESIEVRALVFGP
ncbi:Fe(II)/2-oxoglutarate-dependent dioxygenase nvfI-like protein [Cladobotryum mycophilum]|uniref:Fe(II)/2-oxoglutarate-dependent dioxygenase nvfI-like protein n=1 Tax=Cladobotryum mycophilum TaxID=491253 RepID=A0ABR0T0Y8_9HYPO